MAIVSVNEDYEGMSASWVPNKRTYTRIFKVRFNAPATPYEAVTADDGVTAIPDLNDAHNEDANAYARKITPEKVDNSRIDYIVRVDYETLIWGTLIYDNPLSDDPIIQWTPWVNQKVPEKDKDGAAIVNSAGERFDPMPELDHYNLQVNITRNEASYTPATAASYLGSVNASSVTVAGLTIGAREGKMVDFSGQSAERNGTGYYIVNYTIQINTDTWDLELLDQGMRQLVGGVLVHILEDNPPVKVTEPWRLNGSGARLATGATAVYITDRWRPETNWSSLSLPTTM